MKNFEAVKWVKFYSSEEEDKEGEDEEEDREEEDEEEDKGVPLHVVIDLIAYQHSSYNSRRPDFVAKVRNRDGSLSVVLIGELKGCVPDVVIDRSSLAF